MDKIEKIKAEIERLIEMNKTKNGFPAGTMCAVRIETYENLLSFINSLPEEQPSGDLVKEVQRYYFDNFDYISSDQPTLSILTNIARHFANWQKEQMMKEADLRPSWKPSEEQMKALLNIEGDLRAFQSYDKAKIIAELYEQLKRLL